MAKHHLLLFGVTGCNGKYVLEKAVTVLPSEEYNLACFVRNPSKIPESISAKVQLIEGDMMTSSDVKSCISKIKPDTIIITTSPGYGNEPKPFNPILVPFIVEALTEDGRLGACRLIYLSGGASPNPPIPPDFKFHWFFNVILWMVKLQNAVNDNNVTHNYLYNTNPAFNFVVVKSGMMQELDSKGKLIVKRPTTPQGYYDTKNVQSFRDMGDLLISMVPNDRELYRREFLNTDYEK